MATTKPVLTMRIAFVVTEYITEPNFAGGLANYTYRVAQSLSSLGHDVEVFVSSSVNETIVHDGININRVKSILPERLLRIKKIKKFMFLGGVIALQQRLNAVHLKKPFDLVQYTHLLGVGALRSPTPSIVRLSSHRDLWVPYGFQFTSPLERFMEDIALKRADAIFCPSYWVAEYTSSKLRRPVSVIESPFIPPNSKSNDHHIVSTLWDNKNSPQQFGLYYGSIAEWKGVFVLADALVRFLDKHQEIGFVFVGRDLSHKNGVPASQYLQSKLSSFSERVRILPALPHEQLYPIIRKSSFVTLPSLADNLPNTCLESMWFEKVVIGTRGRSFDQLIDDGKSGLLCEPGDVSSLESCMERAVFMTPSQRELMGNLARKRIEVLSPDRVGKQLETFYKQVIESKLNNVSR